METTNIFNSGHYKIGLFCREIRAWKDREYMPPITLEIHPTERCNHSCPSCQSRINLGLREASRRAREGVDLDLDILSKIWHMPPKGVVISGNSGDPLLHPEILQLFDVLYENHVPCVLITNGQNITPEIAFAAVRCCSGIRVSLDAFDEVSFKRTHGIDASWEKVIQGIKELKRNSHCNTDCILGVGYLTDRKTAKGMEKATRLAVALGVDYIQFRPYHNRLTNIDGQIAKCREIAKGTSLSVWASTQKYRLCDNQRSYKSCHGSFFYAVLDARADLYVCCHHVGRSIARTGNLRMQGWEDWIRSSARVNVANLFPNSDCVMGCRLHTHNEFLQSVLNCEVNTIRLAKEIGLEAKKHACFL